MAVYLGIDGGGTKTAFVLVDDAGRELASARGASAYHLEHGLEGVREVFVDGVSSVVGEAGIDRDDIAFAFVAIPTYGEASREVPLLDELPARALGHDRYRCGNDMIAGWAGSLGATDGINVVAGTGSMTYGEHAGASARVGGWGEAFGDEGSGYWLGLRALTLFSRMSDGRLPRSELYRLVRSAAGVEADLDVIDVVFESWGRSRGRIAALAPLVVSAAAEGDAAAEGLLDRAAEHLVDLVDATRRRLGFEPGEPVPVSYSGGVFTADAVRSRFVRLLASRDDAYDVRAPRFSSHVGAALYAARLAGAPLSPAALERLAQDRGDVSAPEAVTAGTSAL
jgi:N-acetylglucosamine kinase-like BadF-type ATPase